MDSKKGSSYPKGAYSLVIYVRHTHGDTTRWDEQSESVGETVYVSTDGIEGEASHFDCLLLHVFENLQLKKKKRGISIWLLFIVYF